VAEAPVLGGVFGAPILAIAFLCGPMHLCAYIGLLHGAKAFLASVAAYLTLAIVLGVSHVAGDTFMQILLDASGASFAAAALAFLVYCVSLRKIRPPAVVVVSIAVAALLAIPGVIDVARIAIRGLPLEPIRIEARGPTGPVKLSIPAAYLDSMALQAGMKFAAFADTSNVALHIAYPSGKPWSEREPGDNFEVRVWLATDQRADPYKCRDRDRECLANVPESDRIIGPAGLIGLRAEGSSRHRRYWIPETTGRPRYQCRQQDECLAEGLEHGLSVRRDIHRLAKDFVFMVISR
jgi:hypothetical protein